MRMTSALPLAALLALVACDPGPARPDRVDLDRSRLAVAMTDGSTCLGPAPASGAEAGWSGTLQGCPWAYPYRVEIDPRTNPLRFVLQEVLGALGGADILAPLATVTITGNTGIQFRFESPERVPAN